MRILCLAFLLAEYPQLLRKFDAQARGLARVHPCEAHVIGPRPLPDAAAYAFKYTQMPWVMPLYYAYADALIAAYRPDVVYFRYLAADEALYAFAERHGNIVFEHNTIEEAEYEGPQRVRERRFGAKAIACSAGHCCVTNEILEYERERCGRVLPGMVMGNGIRSEEVPPLRFDLPEDAVHMVCAAHFARWHGMDRLIHGMAAYKGPKRFVLHLAGNGPEVERYVALAEELGLAGQVVPHGFCDRAALDALTARCHVGVGALGIHRKALSEAAAIKLREYCLQGIPFFFSGLDPDFEPLPEFARRIPNDESPVDMRVVEDLADLIQARPSLRADMRSYGEDRLSWARKAERMAAFLEECAAGCATRRGAARNRPSDVLAVPDTLPESAALWVARLPQGVFLLDALDAHVRLLDMSAAAQEWALKMAAAHGNAAAAQLWGGFAHEARRAFPEALAAYMRAMQLDETDWQAPLRLVFLQRAMGNLPKAALFTDICLQRNPELIHVLRQ